MLEFIPILGMLLSAIATVVTMLVRTIMRSMQTDQRDIIKSQLALTKTVEEFRGEVFRHYATNVQVDRLATDIAKLRDDLAYQNEKLQRGYMDRIHKVIEEDIKPLREHVQLIQSDVSVLKAK